MKDERKQQLIKFCIEVAKYECDNTLSENDKIEKINLGMSKIRPNFMEIVMMDGLISDFIEKIERGEKI